MPTPSRARPTEERVIVALAPAPARPSVPRDGGARPRPRAAVRWLVCGLLLWLFVGPRIEVAALHGLRLEDFVFAVLAVLCLLHRRCLGRPDARMLAILGVGAAGLVSAGVAVARGMVEPVTSVLFALRPVEYWIAFPAALLVLRGAGPAWRRRIDLVLAVVTVLQTVFAVLQYYFQLPIGFSHAAYTRAAGLTVGPYELGAMAAALLVYWLTRRRWVLAALTVVALAASISRVSVLGAGIALGVLAVHALLALRRRVVREGWRRALTLPRRPVLPALVDVLAVAASVLVLLFTLGVVHLPQAPERTAPPVAVEEAPADDDGAPAPAPAPPVAAPDAPEESIASRLASTSVIGSWISSGGMAAVLPHLATSAEYQSTAYAHLNEHVDLIGAAASGGEPSNLVRFFRWHLLLDTVDDPLDVVFGLGPSFAGPSVDGSYLRFFADGGLLGLLAWGALIVVWLRRSPLWMVCVTLTLLVGALFIDIVYAQRPMALYWTLLAVALTGPRPGRADDAQGAPPQEAVVG